MHQVVHVKVSKSVVRRHSLLLLSSCFHIIYLYIITHYPIIHYITVIQNVHQKRSSPSSTSFEVQYKEDGDPRSALTEADLNAQSVIMCCIRSIYGSELKIIGEEDEDHETEEEILTEEEQRALFQTYHVRSLTHHAVERDLFGSQVMVDIQNVCLYIDVSFSIPFLYCDFIERH